ncbi:MAG: N-acetylglucosamine repressor [Verrucomicrobia bacterium ADurb.Bin070]|nr:MAG: N-acetylglucosamine repressor [Verrucomicrobia bacterium ADurb.Bin070]
MLQACAQEAGVAVQALSGVGMNIPGMVTPDGHVLGSPSAGWGAFHARPLLANALALPGERLFFENDINACALAEQRFGGAGDDFVWLTISTGNGGAVVTNGKLVRGGGGCAGEFGHLKVERDTPYPCGCGGCGCLEAHASGVAIARRAVEAGLVYAQTGVYLGRALAIAANLMNPTHAFIGGGASKALDLMLPSLQRTLALEALPQCGQLAVTQTSLGYEAAVMGAAAVCLTGLTRPRTRH